MALDDDKSETSDADLAETFDDDLLTPSDQAVLEPADMAKSKSPWRAPILLAIGIGNIEAVLDPHFIDIEVGV